MRFAVVVSLVDGFQLLRREFDSESQHDLAGAFRHVAQTVMDDASMLSPQQVRINVTLVSEPPAADAP